MRFIVGSASENAPVKRFQWGIIVAVGLILLFTQTAAFAQFASGSIGATVTDATGAAIPGAKVVLKNEATGAVRDTVTNGTGYFDFPSVLPASYSVTVSAPGLRTAEQTGIVLDARFNFALNDDHSAGPNAKNGSRGYRGRIRGCACRFWPVQPNPESEHGREHLAEWPRCGRVDQDYAGHRHRLGTKPEHVGSGSRADVE